MTTQKRTDELQPGDVLVHPETDRRGMLLPITTAHPGHLLVVQSKPQPWILTAGPHAGEQATNGRRQGQGAPLLKVEVDSTDIRWEPSTPCAPADQLWDVVVVKAADCAESRHSWCGTHDAPWQPFADTCDGVV